MTSRAIPREAARSLRLYNLLFPLVFAVGLPGYLLRLLRRGNFRAHFGQRLGIYSGQEQARLSAHRWTWIQSISVGETLVALKLVAALREQLPGIPIVLSTTTTTGFALAEAQRSETLRPIYNPIDLPFIVRRVVALLRPEHLIVIEGGMWPNILAECYKRGASVLLANARLSPRSGRRFAKFRRWTSPLFRLFDKVLLPENEDKRRWLGLSVAEEKLRVTGSIKFDQPAGEESNREEEFRASLRALGVKESTPVIVAGSTFPGEERLLVEAWKLLRKDTPELFLILVPRHVERCPAIENELAPQGVKIVRRSNLVSAQTPTAAEHSVLLVDTTGELRDWYRLATVAFVGKSITAIGGQNPAEPAVLGKPVLFGPHMENFSALAARLIALGAAREIASAEELKPMLHELLSDEKLRSQMAIAAAGALADHLGATARAAGEILSASRQENDLS